MTFEENWDLLGSSDRSRFQYAARRLLRETFVVREKNEDSRKEYRFISANLELFTQYFSYIGYDIVRDPDNGVIMLQNCGDFGENGRIQASRKALRKYESIILCSLWTLYADRMRTGTLEKSIFISVAELQFELEKFGARDLIDRNMLREGLKTFGRFNLISVEGNFGDEDCRIRLYPSLQFALNTEEFRRFIDAAGKRMKEDVSDEIEEDLILSEETDADEED
ncbi:MAG: DUF4194 domain-containing protein [Lachnospiraceae bacterium]|nr:DUF4194 domain-containing protein [Lachnospiraceae bacterium]